MENRGGEKWLGTRAPLYDAPMSAGAGVKRASLGLGTGLLIASCGAQHVAAPTLCVSDPAPIQRALARAPAPVRLIDGSSIATCVARASSSDQLEGLGATLTHVADDLAVRAVGSDGPAVQLGYLIGAVRRGGAHSNGVDAELIRRVEQDALLYGAPPARHAAVDRGIAAGSGLG